jgi:HrpA-like RNA helicase
VYDLEASSFCLAFPFTMQRGFKRLSAIMEANVPAASVRGDQPVAVESVEHRHLEELTSLAASGDNGNENAAWRRGKSAVSRLPLSTHAAQLQENISALPVSMSYEAIAKLLETQSVVVIGADTGTGKTTQVPQIAADVVWSHHRRTGKWLGRIIVALPTRVGAESLFWRLVEETSVRPGDLAALRTGTVQYGDSNAFLMVCTHGYLSKILDLQFLQSVAYLILDESQQRTLTLSFIKAILKRFRRTTRLVLMGAGLDVAAI